MSQFSERPASPKPCKEGPSQDDPIGPLALTVLGVLAWSLMAILGTLLDPENRDAGVATFDAWFTHGGALPERYDTSAGRLHETWWHLLLFAPLLVQVAMRRRALLPQADLNRPLVKMAAICSLIVGTTMLVKGFGLPSTVALNWALCGVLTDVISRTGIRIKAAY